MSTYSRLSLPIHCLYRYLSVPHLLLIHCILTGYSLRTSLLSHCCCCSFTYSLFVPYYYLFIASAAHSLTAYSLLITTYVWFDRFIWLRICCLLTPPFLDVHCFFTAYFEYCFFKCLHNLFTTLIICVFTTILCLTIIILSTTILCLLL